MITFTIHVLNTIDLHILEYSIHRYNYTRWLCHDSQFFLLDDDRWALFPTFIYIPKRSMRCPPRSRPLPEWCFAEPLGCIVHMLRLDSMRPAPTTTQVLTRSFFLTNTVQPYSSARNTTLFFWLNQRSLIASFEGRGGGHHSRCDRYGTSRLCLPFIFLRRKIILCKKKQKGK